MAWKSAGTSTVSRVEAIGLGGLFLHTSNPPPAGTVIELLFELESGEVRARANVRDSIPGKGMGVQFVQMGTGDRARLHQFLANDASVQPASQFEAGCSQPVAERKGAADHARQAVQIGKKRSFRRCSLIASAEVMDLASGTRLSARISELAIGGCYVHAPNPFPEGTIARVQIRKAQGQLFETEAKVIYRHPKIGMGLAFTGLRPEERAVIEDWLAEIVIGSKPTVR